MVRACHGFSQIQQAFADALDALRLSSAVVDTDRSLMSTWSILGRIFTAGHHNNVVMLVSQVWCPSERLPIPEVASSVRSTSISEPMTLKLWALRACGMLDRIVRETQGSGMPAHDSKTPLNECPLCSSLRKDDSAAESCISWKHDLIPEHPLRHHANCPSISVARVQFY